MNREDYIKISVDDMLRLGIRWSEFCDATGGNPYALKEGMSRDILVKVPIALVELTIIKNHE